jgi:hypothetical protein
MRSAYAFMNGRVIPTNGRLPIESVTTADATAPPGRSFIENVAYNLI